MTSTFSASRRSSAYAVGQHVNVPFHAAFVKRVLLPIRCSTHLQFGERRQSTVCRHACAETPTPTRTLCEAGRSQQIDSEIATLNAAMSNRLIVRGAWRRICGKQFDAYQNYRNSCNRGGVVDYRSSVCSRVFWRLNNCVDRLIYTAVGAARQGYGCLLFFARSG